MIVSLQKKSLISVDLTSPSESHFPAGLLTLQSVGGFHPSGSWESDCKLPLVNPPLCLHLECRLVPTNHFLLDWSACTLELKNRVYSCSDFIRTVHRGFSSFIWRQRLCGDVIAITSWAADVNLVRPLIGVLSSSGQGLGPVSEHRSLSLDLSYHPRGDIWPRNYTLGQTFTYRVP